MERIEDARLRRILSSLVEHLHQFVRDVALTEEEFRQSAAIVARLGQLTGDRHNEVILMAGSLGISALVCMLNNPDGTAAASGSLLGPFWRMHAPSLQNGASLLRSPTAGEAFEFTGQVHDREGKAVAAAEVDVWHSSPAGLYENQDPAQAEMNLRGKFLTDALGCFSFRSVKPAGYPIPAGDNVVGGLLRAQQRHNYRPAHLHVLIFKPGFKTLITQIFMPGDPHLEDDVQFGVRPALIGRLVTESDPDSGARRHSMRHSFVMDRGEAFLPLPPIR